jgi:hypothetical protein
MGRTRRPSHHSRRAAPASTHAHHVEDDDGILDNAELYAFVAVEKLLAVVGAEDADMAVAASPKPRPPAKICAASGPKH